MKQKILLVALALLVVGAGVVFGQNVDNHAVTISIVAVSVLDVDDAGTAVALQTIGPGEAGNPGGAGDPVIGSSGEKAIFYTVLTTAARSIQAEIDIAPPAGTLLSVNADPQGFGTTAADVTLQVGTANDIITAIGSLATGRTPATAPTLTYTLVIDDETALQPQAEATITVTLTFAP